ncbi:hypothetical protein MMC08_000927 [Hypocenomyce scalaris]|nr:hypothetical protein [Hypocenomyce scalaris]
MDFLKSAVASAISKGPPFPYTFGDRVEVDNSIWTLYNGVKKEDGSSCSIFTFDSLANKLRLPLARNAVRKLRTLRHPGVLKVFDTVETDSYIYIATERVTPLGWHVRRKSLSVETLKWGLYTIANTLKFINDEAASVHGNVRVSSIFTSESGEWRLGGFDVLSSMKDDDAIICAYGGSVPDSGRYAAPEIAKGGWGTLKRNPVAAVDAYGYGLLIFEVFNGSFMGGDQIGQTKNIPFSMHQSYKRLLNVNPKSRLSTSHFLEQGRRNGGFFETPLVRLSEAIESLGLKSDGEREEFISELDEVSDDFPEEFFKMKVLPELLKSVEFGGGGPKVFSAVMKIGSKLSEEDYESRITPVVVRLFASPDRAIRVCLLDNLPRMIDHLSQKVVNDKIFPQLVTGFTDVAPVVREQTVKAVLTIITKLSDRTINGELLKYLAKTSNDEQPGIRTNTTICLGKIARSLGTNVSAIFKLAILELGAGKLGANLKKTRQKVLTAAFARSLRDPFVHARNAALMALAVTSDLFTEEDCASKILPLLCPSLIDKEKLIRDQANKTFDVYTQRIRKYAGTLPETVLPPPSTGAVNGAVPRMGTLQNDTSWAGWAISSFTNKIATASGDMQSKPNGTLAAPGNMRPSSVPPRADTARPALTSTASTSTLHRQTLLTPSAPEINQPITDQFFDSAQAGDEIDPAWGDMDEDFFFDAPLGVKPSAPTPSFDDGGEPDFAGWLSAQAQAKSKPPLPKGLTRPSTTTLGNNQQSGSARSTTTGSVGSGLGLRKLATAAPKPTSTVPKKMDTKPKERTADDDWGDAWD